MRSSSLFLKRLFTLFAIVLVMAADTIVPLNVNSHEVIEPGRTSEGKVVAVVADYLDIKDINNMEYLRELAGKSHLALINNRQPGKANACKSKLIIGSGKRLELDADIVLEDIVKIEGHRAGTIMLADIEKIRSSNADSGYNDYIGYIGDEINKNNGLTCFIGNADTDVKNRSSLLIAMDSKGEVDLGETENIHIADSLFPFGFRSDYKRLAELYKQYLPASSFIIVETGDMERLEALKASISDEDYELNKKNILKNIDGFIKQIAEEGSYKTLIIISTYPSKANELSSNKLTPVIVYEKGESGILYSSNTKRDGIILNTDLTDYMLNKLGYKENSFIEERELENPVEVLEKINNGIVRTSLLRAPVLTDYALMMIVALVILFAIAALWGKGNMHVWLRHSSLLGYIMISFPIAFLYVFASSTGDNPVKYIAVTLAASALLSIIVKAYLKDNIKIILSICLMLLAGLSLDILLGSPLIKQSVLGYDPIIGARFYGIGNEYCGMYIGCSLMVLGCIQELKKERLKMSLVALYFIICTCFLGLSFMGANYGGALAGAFGYLLAYFLMYDIKFNKRNIFMGITIFALTAVGLVLADSLGIFSQSHVGKLVKDTEINGFSVLVSTIKRKISMNLRLIRYTIWTKVLLCIIITISIMFYKPVKQMADIFNKYKYLRYSWISLSASAIAGLAINDSGIVMAATSMIYAAFTMLIMCIGERNEN